MEHIACSGVILSGGLNSRMKGKNKALLTVGGGKILDSLSGLLKNCFEQVLLVTNAPMTYLAWDMMMVADLFSVRSSLTGIHAGLFHAPSPYIYVTACDTPFLKKDLVGLLTQSIDSKWDVIIPETEEGLQPLCAVYSKRCLKPIERQLRNDHPRIVDFFPSVRVKKIPEDQCRSVDPELHSFFNVNTPQDLERAEEISKEHSA